MDTVFSQPGHVIAQHDNVDNYGVNEKPMGFLVCVDKRPESAVALRLACIKAAKRRGHVTLLHVIEPEQSQSFFGVSDTMREERVTEAQDMLNTLSTVAADIMHTKPTLLLREGAVGETIIHTANDKDTNIKMLVLGVSAQSSSRGQLVAWLSTQLGSKLLIPVMLVPGNLTDQQIIDVS